MVITSFTKGKFSSNHAKCFKFMPLINLTILFYIHSNIRFSLNTYCTAGYGISVHQMCWLEPYFNIKIKLPQSLTINKSDTCQINPLCSTTASFSIWPWTPWPYLRSASAVPQSEQIPFAGDPSSLDAEIPGTGRWPFAKSVSSPHGTSSLPPGFYRLWKQELCLIRIHRLFHVTYSYCRLVTVF